MFGQSETDPYYNRYAKDIRESKSNHHNLNLIHKKRSE